MSWKDKKEDIQKYIEKNQPEIYWDQNDELSEKDISKILESEEGLNEVENEIWENNLGYICDLENETIKEVISHFDLEEEMDEGENEEEFRDFCRDYISVDMNVNDLLNRTGDLVFFYETDVSTSGYGQSEKEYKEELKSIKKVLKIKMKDKTHDEKIMQMIYQASYGGQLVVYFNADLSEWVKRANNPSIKFGNVNIAIIDTANGSGDSCFLNGTDFTLPFDQEKVFYERSIHYNYTYEVCGMSSDWCADTQWSFSDKKVGEKSDKKSITRIHKEKNEEYDRVYKSGKCSFGDMDITRHRNTTYVNEYPCGNRCPHCGTFWID